MSASFSRVAERAIPILKSFAVNKQLTWDFYGIESSLPIDLLGTNSTDNNCYGEQLTWEFGREQVLETKPLLEESVNEDTKLTSIFTVPEPDSELTLQPAIEKPDFSKFYGQQLTWSFGEIGLESNCKSIPVRYNYVMDWESPAAAGSKARYQDNVSAIKLLHKLEQSNQYATLAEQKILAKYTGWGSLPQVFDEKYKGWTNEHQELQVIGDNLYFRENSKMFLQKPPSS